MASVVSMNDTIANIHVCISIYSPGDGDEEDFYHSRRQGRTRILDDKRGYSRVYGLNIYTYKLGLYIGLTPSLCVVLPLLSNGNYGGGVAFPSSFSNPVVVAVVVIVVIVVVEFWTRKKQQTLWCA